MCTPDNQPRKARATFVNVNSDETLFYPFTVCVNNCRGSCNTTDDLYNWFYVRSKVKNMNVKVLKLISGVNQTRFIV